MSLHTDYSRRWNFFLLLLMSCFFSCNLMAKELETIEALLVIDSKNNLKRSVSNDEKIIRTLLRSVADTAKMKLAITVYRGNNVSLPNIQKWIGSLQNRHHDVLFFYFSGHGCKDNSPSVPWPYFFLSAKNRFLPMRSIISSLKAIPTRLSIILSDCCNGPLSQKSRLSLLSLRQKALVNQQKHPSSAIHLFKETKGHICATASNPGKNAFSYIRGSVFTLAFSGALYEALSHEKISWKQVFRSTKTSCSLLQTPYVSIELKK